MRKERLATLLSFTCRYCWILFIMLGIQVSSATAQTTPTTNSVQAEASPDRQTPDLTQLTVDWWLQLNPTTPEIFSNRIDEFITQAIKKIQGLNGNNLIQANTIVDNLRAQLDLLKIAQTSNEPSQFDPILRKETYYLNDILTMRAAWREVRQQMQVITLDLNQLELQTQLLQQARDKLLRQYNTAAQTSPERVILGLKRVSAQIEHELLNQQAENLRETQSSTEQYAMQLSEQLNYAKGHTQPNLKESSDFDEDAENAGASASAAAQKITAIQKQLLDALASDNPKPSLILTRKQQLTRANAEQALASIQAELSRSKSAWIKSRSDTQADNTVSTEFFTGTQALIGDLRDRLGIWQAASQSTLITPIPTSGLNAIKNIELAHLTARETLGRINEIQSTIDDVELIQQMLAQSIADGQTGFKGTQLKLSLFFNDVWNKADGLFSAVLFRIGDSPVTLGGIFKMILILAAAYALSRLIRFLLNRLKTRRKVGNSPAIYTLSQLLHYLIMTIAVFVAITSIGFNFTNFALIAGALSVGIGFGLQSIVNNFVSGLIILFEASLRVGDYIELDNGLAGVVKEINTRSTIINTNDSIDVVVPNSDFITHRLTNWTLRESMARLRVPFGVAYGSDKDTVKKAAMEAVAQSEFVLLNMPDRAPQIRLSSFGDSSLNFEILVWVSRSGVRRPHRVRSGILWALEEKLNEYGIEIPFPQRDLHFRGEAPNS